MTHQSPEEILKALQTGDISLDIGDSQDKTTSVLRSIDYSFANISSEAQQLLVCFAPFTEVLDLELLNQYTSHLQRQSVLAGFPFERWTEVVQEAMNWGLLSPDSDLPRFLRLQSVLPYFLRSRLSTTENAEIRHAIETAFCELYEEAAGELVDLLQSKDPQQKLVGQMRVRLEYENLTAALNLALAAQISILKPYQAISIYLEVMQDHQQGLELGQMVLGYLEDYPVEEIYSTFGVEIITVMDDIARRQLALKQYGAATTSYQRALNLITQVKQVEELQRIMRKSSIYHSLGRVAQEQRQWAQAEAYYRQALQLYLDYNDRYAQASVYHSLGRVAQEQRQWAQAEAYYRQALQLYLDYNDRYAQASVYYSLGQVAQEQEKRAEAETYYRQALQTFIDYNDRYRQADIYYQLGQSHKSNSNGLRLRPTIGRPCRHSLTIMTATDRQTYTINWVQ